MARARKTGTPQRQGDFARVYFVGAGLSAGVGYPVGSNLMRDLVEYLQGQTPAQHKRKGFINVLKRDKWRPRSEQILQVIDQVLGDYFAVLRAQVGDVDVAEFFTMANTLADMPLVFADTRALPRQTASEESSQPPTEATLFEDLAVVTRSYFNEIWLRWKLPDDIASLVAKMDPDRHVIINFNWDEELDAALTKCFDVHYTLHGWQKAGGGILMLRPHGSIGWYDVKQGLTNNDLYFIAEKDDRVPPVQRRILAYEEPELPQDVYRAEYSPLSCPPVITPPTFAKRFSYHEQQLIWQDVLEVCSKAYEFVFLGYSMPKDDILTRAAIRRALRYNPDKPSLHCVVCDLSFDDTKKLNFQSVFTEGLVKKHHLKVTFGDEKRGQLGDELEEHLQDARLLG
jgi:hypothetical protein